MKELIKQLLQEAFKKLPYDPRPEMKASQYSSLSKPTHNVDLDAIKFKIAKAANIAKNYRAEHPQDHYFNTPTEGLGYYQVEIRHDGQIKTKHVKASGDMEQLGGRFQPTDLGTCKTFQNVARYCFVAAGKEGLPNRSVGASPAEDAANKVLIIFKDEILDFLGDSGYEDDKAAEISKEKMSQKQTLHKVKKDLETKLNRRLTDAEWNTYLETGIEPKTKQTLGMDPEKAAALMKRQAELQAKIDAMKARRKS